MNIQEVILKILKFFGKVQEATDEDSPGGSKVNLVEIPGLALSAVQLVPVFGELKQVAESIKYITDEEKQQIIDEFAENFDLPNDVVEAKVERIFAWIIETVDAINDLREISAAAKNQPPKPSPPPSDED